MCKLAFAAVGGGGGRRRNCFFIYMVSLFSYRLKMKIALLLSVFLVIRTMIRFM